MFVEAEQLLWEVAYWVLKLPKLYMNCTSFLAFHDYPIYNISYIRDTVNKVTILNRGPFPLSRQLDADGGELVLKRIRAMGVEILTNVSASKLCTTTNSEQGETFTGFDLTDGSHIDAQMVVFAVGISPRDDIAREAGIECADQGGVIVNDDLTTSAPDVYAIGECASWKVLFSTHDFCVGGRSRPSAGKNLWVDYSRK